MQIMTTIHAFSTSSCCRVCPAGGSYWVGRTAQTRAEKACRVRTRAQLETPDEGSMRAAATKNTDYMTALCRSTVHPPSHMATSPQPGFASGPGRKVTFD